MFLLEVYGCYEAANRRRASAYRRRLTRPRRHVDVGSSSESQKREAMRSHESQSAKFPYSPLSGKKTHYFSSDFRKRFFLAARVNLGTFLDRFRLIF